MGFLGFCLNLEQTIDSDNIETIQNPNHAKLRDRILKWLQESLLTYSTNCKNEKICAFLVGCLKKLFRFGVKLNNIDQQMNVAFENGNTRVTKLLLENGAKLKGEKWNDLNLVAPFVLSRKNIKNRKELLKLLLENGLNAGLRNKKCQNFLHIFIAEFVKPGDKDSAEICEILIDSGTSMHETDRYGRRPVAYTCDHYLPVILDTLEDKGYLICEEDMVHLSELLIDKKYKEINFVQPDGLTLLHSACFFRTMTLISVCLQKGADVNVVDSDGMTPFEYLISPGLDDYGEFYDFMAKEFARLNYEKPDSVSRVNMELMDEEAMELYEKCTDELKLMSSTKFYGHYSYYFVLKNSRRLIKLANLTRNNDFVEQFEKNLSRFNYYETDLRIILDKAVKRKNTLLVAESLLNALFGEFLPAIVIGKLAENFTIEDLPEE